MIDPANLKPTKPAIAGAVLLLIVVFAGGSSAGVPNYFEARHTHAIELTPSGERLLAVNSEESRLSVFGLHPDFGHLPMLLDEIPVDLVPVAVRARSEDEVWVVCELSDSISIVSLSQRTVIATLRVPDEPADVVFVAGKAFVSCSQNNCVKVFDANTRADLGTIQLHGLAPRSLAVGISGTNVYVAFLHSGNNTTILPADQAPAPPAPTNLELPDPPQVAQIVSTNHPAINYTVLDHDVAEIDPDTLAVRRYLSGAGTSILDLAVDPASGDLWVANTEAQNLIRFEPNLRGRFILNRATVYRNSAGEVSAAPEIHDLNPNVDYDQLPNEAAASNALAQPMFLQFATDGAHFWTAAFASDRLAQVATDGTILQRIDLRVGGDTNSMRGPRAIALNEGSRRLYVLNKISRTISMVASDSGSVLAEVPLASHPNPNAAVERGRSFLFDARLSGNGLTSCGSCHIDADRDGIAWDLGDPGGEMVTVVGFNLSVHSTTPRNRVMHPMKGPMTTQTLWGLDGGAPFHWRGDRATIQDFNPTFDKLMGGSELAAADIDALADYLMAIGLHPNPYRTLANDRPASLNGGNPNLGFSLFNIHLNHCGVCHAGPRGTDNNLDLHREVGSTQPVKNPSLRTVYQRAHFDPRAGAVSPTGFGLNKDGTGFSLPIGHPYVLHELASSVEFSAVAAFVLSFDTGTPPTVGHSQTVDPTNRDSVAGLLGTLESEAARSASDLVVQGRWKGRPGAFRFDPGSGAYLPESGQGLGLSRAALLERLTAGDAITFRGVPPGFGRRYSTDRDGDGMPDADAPRPTLQMRREAEGSSLNWTARLPQWRIESAAELGSAWTSRQWPLTPVSSNQFRLHLTTSSATGFFRLRRTW